MEELADWAQPPLVDGIEFLSSVANPSTIIETSVDYRNHREEGDKDKDIAAYGGTIRSRSIQDLCLFLKAMNSLVAHAATLIVA